MSHAYTVGITWKKIEMLGKHKDIELFLLTPKKWKHTLKTYSISRKRPKNFKLISRDAVFKGRNYYYFFRGLKKIINDLKPDIIHIEEEPSSLMAYRSQRAAKSLGSKLVFFTWENIYKKYPFPFSKFERFVIKNADYAICGNLGAQGIIRRKGFKKSISVLPQFGLDIMEFRKKKSPVRKRLGLKNDFVVGFVGRLVKQKGLLTLIEAVKDIDCKLLILGGGPLKDRLLKMYKNKIIFVDTVLHERVVDYINAMDCLVLPSESTDKWKEQFGHVLIEAMACEVPVIGSSCGAIPEVIGDAGLIFKEGNKKGLSKKISMLMKNKKLRQKLSKKARNRVLKKYSLVTIDRGIYNVYRKLMK